LLPLMVTCSVALLMAIWTGFVMALTPLRAVAAKTVSGSLVLIGDIMKVPVPKARLCPRPNTLPRCSIPPLQPLLSPDRTTVPLPEVPRSRVR
jgi:hypothetical protein